MSGNNIGDHGATKIGKALESNSKFPKCPQSGLGLGLGWLAGLAGTPGAEETCPVEGNALIPGHTPASSIPAGCMQDAGDRILGTGYRMAWGFRMADVMRMHGCMD